MAAKSASKSAQLCLQQCWWDALVSHSRSCKGNHRGFGQTKENGFIQHNSVGSFFGFLKGPATPKSCHFSFLKSNNITSKHPTLQLVNRGSSFPATLLPAHPDNSGQVVHGPTSGYLYRRSNCSICLSCS